LSSIPEAAGTGGGVTGAVTDDADTITYTTASGKLVRLSRRIKIPTASAKTKRKVVRVGTTVVFVAVVGGIVAFIVVALVYMMNADKHRQVDEQTRIRAIEGYDPNVNPFTMKQANVLGVPIRGRTAVVVEAGDRTWLSTVKSAIEEGLARSPATSKQQIIFFTDQAPRVFPEVPARVAQAQGLPEFLREVSSSVDAQADAAIDKALEGDPQQIIFITGGEVPASVQLKLSEALQGKSIRLDVVSIGRDQPALAGLAEAFDGMYLTMPANQINEWYAQSHE
jgi:hypothetical protein